MQTRATSRQPYTCVAHAGRQPQPDFEPDITLSMESLQVKEVGLKTPESGLKDFDAKAAAYTAETGSYMYMCPEVKLPLESRKKLHLHVAMLTW